MGVPLGFVDFLSPPTFIIVAILAILLYGERLPEVAKSFGKNFMAFKKSIQGIREEFESAVSGVTSTVTDAMRQEEAADRDEATAPKFEPPPAEALPEALREEATAPKFQPPPGPPGPDAH